MSINKINNRKIYDNSQAFFLFRLRSDEHFGNFYTKSEITASNLNISLSNDKKRRTNINSTLTNYVITSTTGFKNTDITIQNMRVMYFTVLDNILSEMNKRFDNNSDFYLQYQYLIRHQTIF